MAGRTIVSVSVGDPTVARIDRIAARDKVPRSTVLRQLIEMAIDAREDYQPLPEIDPVKPRQ